jgi:hypothetical protein
MICLNCSSDFQAQRCDAVACSPRCKKAIQRLLKKRFPGTGLTLRTVASYKPYQLEMWRNQLLSQGAIFRPRRSFPGAHRFKRDIINRFPHGTLVEYAGDGPLLRPGRVNWLSPLGDTLRKSCDQENLPVDTLLGVLKIPVVSIKL